MWGPPVKTLSFLYAEGFVLNANVLCADLIN